ncbi:hypothetical protein G6F37_008223 [Rhizopus arrhizus]|nr:hypothetical protein G6F38_007419 [Rhizopus arrhizus]KAG1155781.1 hypothetical protein G6F37_008223 [Rhizopus arrhizus]
MKLIAFTDKTNEDVDNLVELHLPCPRSSRIAIYFHNHLNQLFEIQKVTGPGRKSAWLIDNTIYKDGAVRFISLMDPLFMCLPIFEKAAEDNRFRALDDIFTREHVIIEGDSSEMDIHRLTNIIQKDQLAHICDIKDVGIEVYRLNNELVLNWLEKKVNRLLVNTSFIKMFEETGLDKEHLKLEAVYSIANYLTREWFIKLLNRLGLEELKEEIGLTEYATDTSPASYFKRTNYDERMMDRDSPAKKKAPAVPRSLAKVNTKGMKALTSFFTKK